MLGPVGVAAVAGLVVVALVGAPALGDGGVRGGDRSRISVLERVIDGDTIALRSGEHVRLIGINTPETKYSEFGAECFGARASRFAERLLHEGERVRLVFDVERRDRYDRLLAYVYRERDGLFVNARIVEQGYAYVETVPPNVVHVDLFRRLAREAREHDRGLWSPCPTEGGQPRSLVGTCLSDYQGACVPPPPPDLDCADLDLGDLNGPITVVGDDPHRLDGNHDGMACEAAPPG